MNNSQYKLAIVIPNWNGSQYLPDLLNSIIVQSFQDWRCFIVDDQSTDNSLQIIKEYHEKDKRICYYVRDKQPKGAQTCRNIGFELSVGAEFVVFFDNDDLIAPYCFSQRIRFMEDNPDVDFGIFPAICFEKEPYDVIGNVYGYQFSDDLLKSMLDRTLPIVGWTNIYRRDSYVKKSLKWDVQVMSLQDTDFNIQALLKGCKYQFCSDAKADYYYRIVRNRATTTSKILSINHFKSHAYLICKIINSLSANQRDRYKLALRCYVIKYLAIIKSEKNFVKEILDNSWVANQSLFFLKLKIWLLFAASGKIRDILFSKEMAYEKDVFRKWQNHMKERAVELRMQENNE